VQKLLQEHKINSQVKMSSLRCCIVKSAAHISNSVDRQSILAAFLQSALQHVAEN